MPIHQSHLYKRLWIFSVKCHLFMYLMASRGLLIVTQLASSQEHVDGFILELTDIAFSYL